MDRIELECACGKGHRVPMEYLGRRIRCTACGEGLLVELRVVAAAPVLAASAEPAARPARPRRGKARRRPPGRRGGRRRSPGSSGPLIALGVLGALGLFGIGGVYAVTQEVKQARVESAATIVEGADATGWVPLRFGQGCRVDLPSAPGPTTTLSEGLYALHRAESVRGGCTFGVGWTGSPGAVATAPDEMIAGLLQGAIDGCEQVCPGAYSVTPTRSIVHAGRPGKALEVDLAPDGVPMRFYTRAILVHEAQIVQLYAMGPVEELDPAEVERFFASLTRD